MNRNQHQRRKSTAWPLGQINKDLLSLLVSSHSRKTWNLLEWKPGDFYNVMIPRVPNLHRLVTGKKEKSERKSAV